MLRRKLLTPVLGAICGFAVAAASILGLAVFVAPQPAGALASYTQQTGLSCGRCHTNPAGGALTGFGRAFAANGHKVPSGTKSNKKEATTVPAVPAPESTPGPAIVLDDAQAQALSLRYPYYSHFIYSPCDYSNCSK